MSTIPLCVADQDGSFQGCGAPLPREGTSEEHLDHSSECSRPVCSRCGTTVGEHYPGCSQPWEKAAAADVIAAGRLGMSLDTYRDLQRVTNADDFAQVQRADEMREKARAELELEQAVAQLRGAQ